MRREAHVFGPELFDGEVGENLSIGRTEVSAVKGGEVREDRFALLRDLLGRAENNVAVARIIVRASEGLDIRNLDWLALSTGVLRLGTSLLGR